MAKSDILTVRQEILLQLYKIRTVDAGHDAPYEATREGISRSIDIRPNHVSREIKAMFESHLIEWSTVHVLGFRKRVRIYNLTETGRAEAEQVIADLKSTVEAILEKLGDVEVHPIDGTITSDELPSRVEAGGRSLVQIERNMFGAQHAIPPPPEAFFGRDDEARSLSEWWDDKRANILVLFGIAGIGKTSLVSKWAQTIRGVRKIYFRLHEWDTPRGFLEVLANAFAKAGDGRLQRYLRAQPREDLTNISMILRDAPRSFDPLIVIDDAWKASTELWKVIMLLCESISKSGVKMILVSRELPRDLESSVVVWGTVKKMRVEGLSDGAIQQILSWRGISVEPSDQRSIELLRSLKGHPLLLRMVQGVEDAQPLIKGDLARFIQSEVYSKLPEEEVKALHVLGVMRYPVEAVAFTRRVGQRVMASLLRKSLIEQMGAAISIHDVMRSFVLAYMTDNERSVAHMLAYEMLTPPEAHVIERAYHSIRAGSSEQVIGELRSEGDRMINSGSAKELLSVLDETLKERIPSGIREDVACMRMKCLSFLGDYLSVIESYKKMTHPGPEATLIAAAAYLEIGSEGIARKFYTSLKRSRTSIELQQRVFMGIANYYLRTSKLDLAVKYDLKALEIAKAMRRDDLIGKCLMELGGVEIYRGAPQRATEHLLEAMKSIRGNEEDLARVYTILSIAYSLRSMNEMALEMLGRAETIYTRCGNYTGQIKCLLNRSMILDNCERLDEAISVLQQGIAMSRKGEIRHLLAALLTNLSNIYNKMQRYDEAGLIAREAHDIGRAIGDERILVATDVNYATSLIHTGKVEEGVRLLEAGLEQSRRIGTDNFTVAALEVMAEGYLALKDRSKARSCADEGLMMARKKGMIYFVKRIEAVIKRVEGDR